MRAVVISGPGSARVCEVDDPVPGSGQVVVDVRRAGICGTDVELFTGQMAYFGQGKTRFPVRPGHEWCGVVSEVGAGVLDGWLGARVTGDTMLGCGRCARCRAGRRHVCADRYEVGISSGWPGALAERVLVPAWSLHRLPSGIDDRAGALVEPGGNAWRAASAAQAGPGRRILVCGPGTIGLLTTAFATAAGADVHVLALDGRRALASSCGATGYLTADDPPPETYDAVVDCTDDHRVPAFALAAVEPGGRVVFIGVSGEPSPVDSRDLVLGDLTAVGILGASAGLGPAIEHYADGRVDPSGLAAVTVGLDQAAEALAGRISARSGTKIHIAP